MRESFIQAIDNLRANKLRSFLTMFGIMWGIVSIVVLSALGEGFRRGNDAVLREFGRNMSIVWGSRTTLQAGGERAGRLVTLTADDARAIKAQGRLVSMVSPEIQRGTKVKSAFNEASVTVHGVEPPYMFMRTIEVDRGRQLNWSDEQNASQVGGDRLGDVQAAVRRSRPRRPADPRQRHALQDRRADPPQGPGQQL